MEGCGCVLALATSSDPTSTSVLEPYTPLPCIARWADAGQNVGNRYNGGIGSVPAFPTSSAFTISSLALA